MDESPHRIGRFEIRSPIGKGGMGTLYLAWDPELERNVAIKVLNRDDEGLRARFIREARSAARLQHPHIITVYDVGRHDGRPFIAMEYVDGFTLATVIRERRKVPLEQKLRWMEELCEGLALAHASGIIHRDIKPANLMIDGSGSLQILDFGIARVLQASDLTQTNAVMGTLNYMSPEQLSGEEIDHRSDIHAVGAVLYELLTFRQAFPGSMADGVLGDIVGSRPVPPGSLVPGLDEGIIRIVERALHKDAGQRYQEAASMGRALTRVRRGLATPSDSELPGPTTPDQGDTATEDTSATPGPQAGSPSRPMVATAILSGTPGDEAAPDTAPPAPVSVSNGPVEPDAPAHESSSRGWLQALVAVAVVVVAGASFILLGRGAPETSSSPLAPAEAQTETPANPSATAVVDSTIGPAAADVDSTSPPDGDTISQDTIGDDPGAEVPRPAEEETAPSDTTTPSPARGPLPARCGLLLQRLSLGEELTEDERDFLARECRRGGEFP